MKNQDFIEYIKLNLKQIYNNISNVFGIDNEEFRILVLNIIKFFEYKKTNKKEYSINVFSIDVLSKLKSELTKLGLTEEEIKQIITKSPIIILYSDNLNDIYYLYKNRNYYGYTVLYNGEYETYLLNSNLDSNIISNNYIIDRMFDYYNVKDYTNEEFDSLECDFKLKNYYFKKKSK